MIEPAAEADVPKAEDFAAFNGVVEGFLLARCLSAVADLNVADALGETPQSAAELARKVGANPDILGRVMRFVAACGVFENANGVFRHNGASRLLRSGHPMSVRDQLGLLTDAWPLFGALDHALLTGRPAAEKAVGGNYWEYLAAHPKIGARFDAGMASKATRQIASLMPIYDFSPFAKIADIGGGRGHFIRAILAAYPRHKGVLFDLPQVIDALDEPADARLELCAGDFFKDAPPAANAYLLMNVIHDWSDAESIAILGNLREHAAPATKLLLVEAPLPEIDGPHPALMGDILMMVYATGRERKQSEYEALLEASRWRLDRVVKAESGIAILEASTA